MSYRSMTRRFLMLSALLAAPEVFGQQRDFNNVPDVETLERLLVDDQRNIVDPSGASVVQGGAASAAPAVQATTSKPQSSARPAEACAPPPGSQAYASIRIQFLINSAVVGPVYREGLGQVAELMRRNPDLRLAINGHTDVSGGDEINLPLSAERARAVVSVLSNQYGVGEDRFFVDGLGSSQLCLPNRPRAAENRRVTFQRID